VKVEGVLVILQSRLDRLHCYLNSSACSNHFELLASLLLLYHDASPRGRGTAQYERYVDPNDLRKTFASAMSTMYKKEVPLYGDLISIVRDTNAETLANTQDTSLKENGTDEHGLELERHGAIRLGTPYELQTVSRIFAIIGLHPVGYYGLSSAGIPMHVTCFRPITPTALEKNSFRFFTSLLRPELVLNTMARQLAMDLLSQRNIFSSELLNILRIAEEEQGG
jgi:uncharacterized glyoxalase superfamily metalloenzyme YdcJ